MRHNERNHRDRQDGNGGVIDSLRARAMGLSFWISDVISDKRCGTAREEQRRTDKQCTPPLSTWFPDHEHPPCWSAMFFRRRLVTNVNVVKSMTDR